ncbi:hypothetical protein IV203_018570 [Nitzschia inconspicua]|uniref:Uncharacterized protein n=1 Tax=Nitzschia inconspicua TaxID=303405 RepID=A0A9K3P7X3_9STRA|nr:hypothetical protein IV203_033390 [Nitzschia inconspicua]KAG7372427.1 hypothetical protein IV203_018570 [Nitzschia inconspicua]
MKATKIVAIADTAGTASSSGSKKSILLRNLGKNDVVFGTKGNGRNEVFLQLLEEYAELYVKSSKFEKMGLIQQLIQDWNGNFYFLNPKTNELGLARENVKKRGSDSSEQKSPVSTSSKLYTSVRRMMNYVVAKNNYQYVQSMPSSSSTVTRETQQRPVAQQQNNVARKRSFSPLPVKSSKRKAVSTSEPPSKKYKKKTKISKTKAPVLTAAPPVAPPVASVTVHRNTRMDTLSPIPTMVGGKQQRAPMLVTPEPSPRTFQDILRDQAEKNLVKGTFPIPSTSSGSMIDLPSNFAAKPLAANLVRPALASRKLTPPPSFKKVLDHKYVHRLEDTAIHTLVSLSTASWTSEQDDNEEDGLFY